MATTSTVDDMTVYSNLNLPLINGNLKARYGQDLIYTLSGPSILLSINPYKPLPNLYSPALIKSHQTQSNLNKPHIYHIASQAYKTMCSLEGINQSLVISGESGAGKTETTKFVLQYLCFSDRRDGGWMEAQILEANTVLESFGNARTLRNDNSSRFGKFLQVCFNKNAISGCVVQDYLLEKSRITTQAEGERNYHVFYQLWAAGKADPTLSSKYHLTKNTYNYLQSTPKASEYSDYTDLRLAMNILQIPDNYIHGIFTVLSSILWLGEINFTSLDGGEAVEVKPEALQVLESLIGIPMTDLLTRRQILVKGDLTIIPLRASEANENRHSMAKSLYSKLFTWLIHHINNCTRPASYAFNTSNNRFIGLLDIFGFENFGINSFEQLCINYTNEKLQRYFNFHVLQGEMEIYAQEGLVIGVEFSDNVGCLELIEGRPGLLRLLSEQCHLPKGSDSGYLTNLHKSFLIHPNLPKPSDPRLHNTHFTIQHYAGAVTYAIRGFVDKNRDTQQEAFFNMLDTSKVEFLKSLCSVECTSGTMRKMTVCEGFRGQLGQLVSLLERTQSWYIRCIKPNVTKTPFNYDDSLVLDQLTYLGMVEVIRIRREGYPIHYEFAQFVRRFGLALDKSSTSFDGSRAAVLKLLKSYDPAKYQLGYAKVFLKLDLNQALEEQRLLKLHKSAVIVQACWRRYFSTGNYRRKLLAARKIQAWFRSRVHRVKYLVILKAVVKIQANVRGVFGREAAKSLREVRYKELAEEMKSDVDYEKDLIIEHTDYNCNLNVEADTNGSDPGSFEVDSDVGGESCRSEPETDYPESENEEDAQKPTENARVPESTSPSPLPEPDLDLDLDQDNQGPVAVKQAQLEEEPIYESVKPRPAPVITPESYTLKSYAGLYFQLPQDQITFSKAKLTKPHLHLYDPENSVIALSIWKETLKYMKGLQKNPNHTIQIIIKHGLNREELRDEIYVQLLRQLSNNTDKEWEEQCWVLLACVVNAFPPSRGFLKYLHWFLNEAGSDQASWIGRNVGSGVRVFGPSSVEIAAARRLAPLSIRIYFLDSRSLTIEVHPKQTGSDAVRLICSRLKLNPAGWWLYSVGLGEEEHVKMHGFLYDVVAAWEIGRQTSQHRLVFKKRLFPALENLTGLELRLIYVQLLHQVKRVTYPLNTQTLIRLSGLQAQVQYGQDYTYDSFSPEGNLLKSVKDYHRSLSGMSSDQARFEYLKELGIYYDMTLFDVSPSGYWCEDLVTHLGVTPSMVYLLPSSLSYNHSMIKLISQSESDFTICLASQKLTFNVGSSEIMNLLQAYCPRLGREKQVMSTTHVKLSNKEREGLIGQIEKIRQELVASGLVIGIKSTLRKRNYWSWGKALSGDGDVKVLFGLVMGFGQEPPCSPAATSIIHSILAKTWSNPSLFIELYLILIKQTTDHPSPNSNTNGNNWGLLSLVCSLRLPFNPIVKRYLLAHVRRHVFDMYTGNGVGARWAEKCLLEGTSPRKLPPSKEEMLSTLSMTKIPLKVYLLDGKYQTINTRPSQNIEELLLAVLDRVGLTVQAKGYALYESTLQHERSLSPTELPAELLSRWESTKTTPKFLLKKHLFIDGWLDLSHPIEKELIYLQLLHSTRMDRFPVSETEAAILVALVAQIKLGDFTNSSSGDFPDYCHVSSVCLPTRIAAVVSHEAVARHHQSLAGSGAGLMKQAVLNLLKSWPWWKVTVFEVKQSFTSQWPTLLWLAVDQFGIHLALPHSRFSTLASWHYETIHSFTPSPTYFLLIAGSQGQEARPSKIVLNTESGYQIGQLVRDYIENVFTQPEIIRVEG